MTVPNDDTEPVDNGTDDTDQDGQEQEPEDDSAKEESEDTPETEDAEEGEEAESEDEDSGSEDIEDDSSEEPSVEDVVRQERREKVLGPLGELRTIPFGPDRDHKWAEVQSFVMPAESLANVMGSPDTMAVEKVDAWAAADEHTRELARQTFGVVGPYDVNPDGDEYREALEAWRSDTASDEQWVRDQLEQVRRNR